MGLTVDKVRTVNSYGYKVKTLNEANKVAKEIKICPYCGYQKLCYCQWSDEVSLYDYWQQLEKEVKIPVFEQE